MKQKTFFILSCSFSIILGFILHFCYNFLNKPFIIGLFVPINESVFEHLKLVLVPLTLFGITYLLKYAKKGNIWNYTANAVILSMIFIPLLHYIYVLIFKNISAFFDIALYILSIVFSYIYIYIKESNKKDKNTQKRGLLILTLLYLLFIAFTICPPKTELFKDPITNTYGIFLL